MFGNFAFWVEKLFLTLDVFGFAIRYVFSEGSFYYYYYKVLRLENLAQRNLV